MEVIYSHSTFSDCTVDLPLCAGGRRLYQAEVHDPTKTRTRPTWHYRRWRLSSLSPSFILRAIVLKGYLTSCPRMLLEEVTAQQFLSRGFIVVRLCGSFGHFQNDYITFPAEWKEIKTQAGRRPTVRSKTSPPPGREAKSFFLNITNQHIFIIIWNNAYISYLSFSQLGFVFFLFRYGLH